MNTLLKLFNVKSHEELLQFIKENPDDERVLEIKALAELFQLDFGEESHDE
ncbi:MAG: hypothetical protein Q4P25_05820 [Tissierellia bacterium]|nr:hypothetical protein [Tissierellia bacterium]